MKRKGEPVFLHIQWEASHGEQGEASHGEQGKTVPLEATLCRAHREEIFLSDPSARGYGRLGSSCDLCEGRGPGRT